MVLAHPHYHPALLLVVTALACLTPPPPPPALFSTTTINATASSTYASRTLNQFGKGKGGIGMVTQSVAVAAPVTVGPLYGAGAMMQPVYTAPMMTAPMPAMTTPMVAGATYMPGPVSVLCLGGCRAVLNCCCFQFQAVGWLGLA